MRAHNRSGDDGSIGLVEQHQILTEGQCFALVTLYFPATVVDMMTPRPKMAAIVWYSKQIAAPGSPPVAATQWAAQGYVFASVELCGFGNTGFTDGVPSGHSLGSLGYAPEDMAHEIGRSLPGFHAGEMLRVQAFLTGRSDISEIALAVADDHLDSAILHELLCSARSHPATAPARLAIMSGQVSFAAPAKARLYSPANYYSWIFGILTACACNL